MRTRSPAFRTVPSSTATVVIGVLAKATHSSPKRAFMAAMLSTSRGAPARLLGLADRGQLGLGAAADITVYRAAADAETMFTTPAWVLKDGVPVVKDGRVVATPAGGTHFATPGFDPGIERILDARTDAYMLPHRRPRVIGHDELCRCGNGGRLLPAACFPKAL